METFSGIHSQIFILRIYIQVPLNLSSKLRSRFGKNLFFSFVTFLRFGFCVRASEAAGGGFQFFPVLHRLESLTGSRTNFLFGWSMSLTCACVYVRAHVWVTVRLVIAWNLEYHLRFSWILIFCVLSHFLSSDGQFIVWGGFKALERVNRRMFMLLSYGGNQENLKICVLRRYFCSDE